MKLTIIPADKTVYENGISYENLDLSTVPLNVHALQFNTLTNIGWIEYIDNDDGTKPQNEVINTLPSWANDAMTAWEQANTKVIAQPVETGLQTA